MALRSRTFPLNAPAAILAVLLTLAGCGGSNGPAEPKGAPTQAPPTGYQWVGLRTDHIWLAVPDSWVVLDLNSMTVQQAMARIQLKGPTAAAMRNAVEQLKTAGGLIVVDTASVATSPFKFATNVNAFCTPSSVVPGPTAASTIISQTQASYPEAHGKVISDQKIVSTSKAVVVRVVANLPTNGGLTVHEVQFITLASKELLCYTTLSTDDPAQYSPQFTKIADSIHFG